MACSANWERFIAWTCEMVPLSWPSTTTVSKRRTFLLGNGALGFRFFAPCKGVPLR